MLHCAAKFLVLVAQKSIWFKKVVGNARNKTLKQPNCYRKMITDSVVQ